MAHHTEEEVNLLVQKFQVGDEQAGLTLMEWFGCPPGQEPYGYIGKFYHLIRGETIRFFDKDTRKFIQLFMHQSEERKALTPWFQYKHTIVSAQRVASLIAYKMQCVSDEDLIQELQCLFLNQVKRFEKRYKHVDFQGYLYNSYRYSLYHYINGLFKRWEASTNLYENLEPLDEEEIEGSWSLSTKDYELREHNEELDNNWIRGLSSSPAFQILSPVDRLILKLYFIDNETDFSIADRLGYSRLTIYNRRHEAMYAVKETIRTLLNHGYKWDDLF